MNKQLQNKIKTFIGENALEAVERDAETAGVLLCEAIDWEVKEQGGRYNFTFSQEHFSFLPCLWLSLDRYIYYLNHAEKAVIETNGADEYAISLCEVLFGLIGTNAKPLTSNDLAAIAVASAKPRLAACLATLAESEAGDEN